MRPACLPLVAALALAPVAGFAGGPGAKTGDAAKPASVKGFDTANLDRSCKPCDDFNKFANGGWIAANPVPAEFSTWGTFNALADRNLGTLRAILEEAAKNTKAAKGSNEQKLGDFYASAMDVDRIEADGLKPLVGELERIDKIKDAASLQAAVAHFHTVGVDVLFGFGSSPDSKASTTVIGITGPGGMGLPDRDYYLKDDEKTKEIRAAYVAHVAKTFELMGQDATAAAASAQTVFKIESALAEGSLTRVERRDPDKTYNKKTRAELTAMTPNFSWDKYFATIGYPSVGAVNVTQPAFLKAMDAQLASVALDDWKTYMRWRLLDGMSAYLSSKFVDEQFDFNGRILTGAKENQPRWKRAVRTSDGAVGEILGQEYVKRTFTPKAKERMLELVRNLKAALKSDIATLSWMDEATRKQATAKLDAFEDKIGYPSVWRDYAKLTVDRSSYAANVMRVETFDFNRALDKIGKPVDRTEWGMTPPTVNAYYSPLKNEIVFPAGILQPPFFNENADDAINYGGIGGVIGHEMTHGFDDQGAKYDAKGNLQNWWSDADLKNFQERAKCVENQFSEFKTVGGTNLQGKLVLGESIADLGGLTIAYAAFQKSLEGKPRPADVDGFTPEQRFFLGWAQVWAANHRAEFEELQAKTNSHPLARYRVNGTVSNMPAFAAAWGCKKDDPMVRGDALRCVIW